ELYRGEQGMVVAQAVERRLAEINIEYASKRDTGRLGPVRLALLADHTWAHWDCQRLARTGGTAEQYKHPCLIADPKFRETIGVQEEVWAPAGDAPVARR